MANGLINMTELVEGLSPALLDKFSPLITIFKAVGILLFVYIIFLILKALFTWKSAYRLKKISKNVEQINEKLDILVRNVGKEKKKKGKKKE